jgi:pyrroline-5-carboxylate reductase
MKVGIIGCGNIGLLYAKSFTHYKICKKEDLFLFDKSEERKEYLSSLNLGQITSIENLSDVQQCDLLILAVKPQDFSALAKQLKGKIFERQTVLSIMAGIKIARIEVELNHSNIVRAMPNTPSLVGMGATVYTANAEVNNTNVRAIENLLSTTGRTFYLEEEDLLDAVTALSGSGPAYFFHIVQSMIHAGTEMGLDEAMSAMLVKQTMLGSFHLLNNADKTLDELIQSVKSKGGTTEAALNHMASSQFDTILKAAIHKAHIRAKELSQ